MGRILEGAALEDKREYQEMVSKWRSIAEDQDVIHQLEEVCSLLMLLLMVATTSHRYSNN